MCACVLLGCSPRHAADDPEHARADAGNVIAVDELAWGFMQPRGGEGRLVLLRTVDDYKRLAATLRDDGYLALLEQAPSFDPATQVLIFVELPDDSGTELRAGVEGITRTDDLVRVRAYRTEYPEGAYTDNITRAWILVRAPKTAFDDDPTLRLELAAGVR